MSRRRTIQFESPFLCLALAILLACGGGGGKRGSSGLLGPANATRLTYTAHTNPGPYQLLQDTALSSDTHMVLKVVGPSGTSGRGIAFYCTADPTKVTWAKVASSDSQLVAKGNFPASVASLLVKAKATPDGVIQAGDRKSVV